MSDKHAGPSGYRPKNQAKAPAAGKHGATAPAAAGRSLGHPHEKADKGPRPSKGFGKIKSTGSPRFKHFGG